MTLDETIAEALRVLPARSTTWAWDDYEARRAAAVRSAVCGWLREDEGGNDMPDLHGSIEVMTEERRCHAYNAIQRGCICGWIEPEHGQWENHVEERVLAALLSYMEGTDTP